MRGSALLLSLGVVAGCGSGGGTVFFRSDAGASVPDGGPRDLAVGPGPGSDLAQAGPRDLAMPPPPPDLAAPPRADLAAPPADLAPACTPRINEILTGTSAGDGGLSEEFIEIYNPCNAAIDLTGWKVGYRSATNVNPPPPPDSTTLITFTMSIPARGYLLFGGANYPGVVDGKLGASMAQSGSMGLRDPGGAIVDSVAFGTVTPGNAFIETQPALNAPLAAPPGASIGRLPNGVDTDDNSRDFATTTQLTPRAANR